MIELLPRDRSTLSAEDQLVLETAYARFDETSAPVDPTEVAFALKGRVTNVGGRFAQQPLAAYLARWSNSDGYVPTLRAAIRLWRTQDLNLAWELYDACYSGFRPDRRELRLDELPPALRSISVLDRLAMLLDSARFASIRTSTTGPVGPVATVRIWDTILDARNLAEYLALREGVSLETTIRSAPRASGLVRGIEIDGFRSFKNAKVDGLGPLCVFAGPNEAGKSNLLLALRFLSRSASIGVIDGANELGGVPSLRRKAAGVGSLLVRAAIEESARASPSRCVYTVRLDRGRDSAPVESLARHASPEFDFRRDLEDQVPIDNLTQQNDQIALALTAAGVNERQNLFAGQSLLANLRDVQKFGETLALREAFRSWAFYAFEPTALRGRASVAGHLEPNGSNLPGALLALGTDSPSELKRLAESFVDLLPETRTLSASQSLAGSPLLELHERGLTDPLSHVDFSDGMLRILALLYLTVMPDPPALICIEEPENGLYPRLVEAVLETLRALSRRTQVFLTSHSVTLLNRLKPEEVCLVHRDEDGSHLTMLDTRADVVKFAAKLGIGTQLLAGSLEDMS